MSRVFGVHGKDRPAQKALRATLTNLNVGGLIGLMERGPDEVMEVGNPTVFSRMYGHYNSTMYAKYCAEGFFENLKGVGGKLRCRRFVAADAVAATAEMYHGPGALPSVITLLNELKTDINAHAVDTGSHPVITGAIVISSPNAFDRESALILANEIRSKYGIHASDAILTTPVWHAATGTDYTLTSDLGSDLSSMLTLVNEIKTQYELHRADATAHTVADTTNVVTSPDAAYPGSPTKKLDLRAAYMGRIDKGEHGNRLAYTVLPSSKFNCDLSEDAASTDTVIKVASAAGFSVGDIIALRSDSAIEGAVVQDKNEYTNELTLTAGLTSAFTVADNTKVKILTFDLTLYKKNWKGFLDKVEVITGLSVQTTVAEYFEDILNHASRGSTNAEGIDVGSTGISDPLQLNPYEINVPVYLASGSEGTAPTNADFQALEADFDPYQDIRFIFNTDSTSEVVNKSLRTYAQTKGYMVALANLAPDQTYEELMTMGGLYMISGDSYMMDNARWLKVSDPIGLGENALKKVPNVGHVLGHIIYRVATDGYQRVPAGPQKSIAGVLGLDDGDNITDDALRTELGKKAGINLITFIPGSGYVLQNARMPSTNEAYRWFNQIFMRIVYKKTFEESFKSVENDESGESLLARLRFGVYMFLISDWNGNERTGGKRAFLQTRNADGTLTTFEDAVTIIADESNNTLSDVLAGNVTVDIFFFPPPPAESLEVGVGISLLLSAA